MSKRTSEASKAIRAAWQKEQELVSQGKGTRDWTPEQQKEILVLGKAYYHSEDPDDVNDGKAFEGHHMKSAEAYPEYQGDSENIQFLSRTEHQDAHGGDYRNTTNGYFDPVTKITRYFGDNKYEPCEIIKLTDPVSQSNIAQVSSRKTEVSPKGDKEKSSGEKQWKEEFTPKKSCISSATPDKTSLKTSKSFFPKKIEAVVEFAKGFSARHPVLAVLAGILVMPTITKKILNSNKELCDDSKSSFDDDYTDFFDTDACDDMPSSRNYPDERSSPEKHTVPPHKQHYHTKDGVILKEKEPYQRGGKLDSYN